MRWDTDDGRYYNRRTKQKNRVVGWYLAVVVASCGALGINTITTTDGGLEKREHVEARPASVAQLTPTAYIIDSSSSTLPGDICRGTDSNGDGPVKNVSRIDQLDKATFVECVRSQTWGNDPKDSPNFGAALVGTLTTPAWLYSTVGALLLVSIYPLLLTLGSGFFLLGQRRQQRREARRKKFDLEQARLELAHAYSRPEEDGGLSHLEFSQAMDKLYSEGLPAAKR